MRIFENSARNFAQGGNLQATTMRGGGVTSLEWSAYTPVGQAMRLGIANVRDPGLPSLGPILQSQGMSVSPGTTIWVGD
jgi:hypothetical protein